MTDHGFLVVKEIFPQYIHIFLSSFMALPYLNVALSDLFHADIFGWELQYHSILVIMQTIFWIANNKLCVFISNVA